MDDFPKLLQPVLKLLKIALLARSLQKGQNRKSLSLTRRQSTTVDGQRQNRKQTKDTVKKDRSRQLKDSQKGRKQSKDSRDGHKWTVERWSQLVTHK